MSILHEVYPAEPYRMGAMGSLGDASYMLIRQNNFPFSYDTTIDKLVNADHDRLYQHDREHTSRCFEKHAKQGELGFENWFRRATDQQIIDFLVDVMKADQKIKWTGYRIMGTVNRSNGYPVWTLELFALGKGSTTKIFSGDHVPNVLPGKRY